MTTDLQIFHALRKTYYPVSPGKEYSKSEQAKKRSTNYTK